MIRDYDQAIALKPDYATAYRNRGTAYLGKGEYYEAIWDYDEAIRLKLNYAGAKANRARAYKRKSQ